MILREPVPVEVFSGSNVYYRDMLIGYVEMQCSLGYIGPWAVLADSRLVDLSYHYLRFRPKAHAPYFVKEAEADWEELEEEEGMR